MEQNKTSKYLKYAIGEILLVMIGILLALQVNNWNNDRLQLQKEKYYLTEILENLKTDTIQLNSAMKFSKQKHQAINECFKELADPNTPANRMAAIGPRFNVLGTYELFIPNDLGFSNMISAENIELIQNDSIRRKLSMYYKLDYKSTSQGRHQDITREFISYIMPRMAVRERYKQVYQVDLEIPSHNDIDLYKDPKVFSYLNLMEATLWYQDNFLEARREEMISLIRAISKELQLDD